MISMTMTEALKLLPSRKLQIRAEAHLEAGVKFGNRILTRHAANTVEVMESRLTDADFATIEPYSDFD